MVNGTELLPRLGTAAGLFLLVGCGSSSGAPESNRSGALDGAELPQQALTAQQLESSLLSEEDFEKEVRKDSNPLAGQLLAVNPGILFVGMEPPEGADLSSEQQSCLNALTRESRVVDSALDASADAQYVFAPNIEVSVALSSSSVEPPNTAELWAQWLEPCEGVDVLIDTDQLRVEVDLEVVSEDYTQLHADLIEPNLEGSVTIGVRQFGHNALVLAWADHGDTDVDGTSAEGPTFEEFMEQQLAALEDLDVEDSDDGEEHPGETASRQAAYAVANTRFGMDNYELDMTITRTTDGEAPVTETTQRIAYPRAGDRMPSSNYTVYGAYYEQVETPDGGWEYFRTDPGQGVFHDGDGWHRGTPRPVEGNVSNNGAYRSVAASLEHVWQETEVFETEEGLLVRYQGDGAPLRLGLTFDFGDTDEYSMHPSEVDVEILADPETHLRIYYPNKNNPETTWDVELDYSNYNSAPEIDPPEEAQSLLEEE